MNVDPRNAADTPFEVHDVLQQPSRIDRQSDELSAQTSAPHTQFRESSKL